jgi:hypothetical protein
MTKFVFIAQQTIATWLEQEKISFVNDIMTIISDGRQFRLQEAVRFINLEEGEDVSRLVGKVKTVDQLAALKAERCHDSVIFQDAAYKVQEGFVGEVMLNDAVAPILLEVRKPPHSPISAPAQPARSGPLDSEKIGDTPTQEKENNDGASDEELLTRFLLKNL